MPPDTSRGPGADAPREPHGLVVRLRRTVLTGLVILAPVAVTAYILVAVFNFMDGIFAPLVDRAVARQLPGLRVPGLGAILTLLLVLLLGWLSTNVVGRRMLHLGERLICRIPVAKSIYSATQGVMRALSREEREAFKRVVLIEYPIAGTYALAFVTGAARWPSLHAETGNLLLVFVPTTPNPTSGFLLLVPRDRAIDLPVSVEQGIRMVISGGILLPDVEAAAAARRLEA